MAGQLDQLGDDLGRRERPVLVAADRPSSRSSEKRRVSTMLRRRSDRISSLISFFSSAILRFDPVGTPGTQGG